jgi:hypothetical protein
MQIDQRNNGASVTVADSTAVYTLDRWRFYENTDAVIAVQQVSDAPAGFSNSMRTTVSTADASLSAAQIGIVSYRIEGTNFVDMAWGTASAQPITISFWAKTSVTGKFSGSLYNMNQGSVARTYVFDYTISAANTWEYKTITIPGLTVGTWTTGTGATLEIIWGLGTGSDYKTATVGQWFTGFASQSTGSVDLVNTLNATWQITGVQLERGQTATSFDVLPYGTELALCQRYYYRIGNMSAGSPFASGYVQSATQGNAYHIFPVSMRATPSTLDTSGTASDYQYRFQTTGVACSTIPGLSEASPNTAFVFFTVASGLTVGNGGVARAATTNAFLGFGAEL